MGGLRLMAVHAHPDEEVTTTAGTLARYADEGVETVLVTCTNGEQSDGPGGTKPGEEGHDEAAVADPGRLGHALMQHSRGSLRSLSI